MLFCVCLEFNELNCQFCTLIMGWRIVISKMAWVNIFSMLYINFLIVFPVDSKRFSFFWTPTRLIKLVHIVGIGGWLLLSVTEHNLRNRLLLAFAESAWFVMVRWWEMGLNDVGTVYFNLFKSIVFWERIAMRCMPPSWCRLRPTRQLFWQLRLIFILCHFYRLFWRLIKSAKSHWLVFRNMCGTHAAISFWKGTHYKQIKLSISILMNLLINNKLGIFLIFSLRK